MSAQVVEKGVSAVVPAYNPTYSLASCLSAVAAQEPKVGGVVVVDDASECVDVEDLVSSRKARVIRLGENSGPAVARNRGVEETSSEYVWFLDDDCVPEPRCLERLLTGFANDKAIGVVGGSVADAEHLRRRYLTRAAYVVDRFNDNPGNPPGFRDCVATANVLVKRAVFDEVGGFDPAFVTNEDNDFCYRSLAKGFRVYFEPKATVTHHHRRRSLMSFLRHRYRIGIGSAMLRLKHRGRVPFGSPLLGFPAVVLLLAPATTLVSSVEILRRNLASTEKENLVFSMPLLLLAQIAWSFGLVSGARRWRVLER